MKKYIAYIIYNGIYQIVSFWLLLYANTFINYELVPESLIWANNKQRVDKTGLAEHAAIKTAALIFESIALILRIYIINQLVLSDTEEKQDRIAIANKTAKINGITSLCFIIILIYVIQYLLFESFVIPIKWLTW